MTKMFACALLMQILCALSLPAMDVADEDVSLCFIGPSGAGKTTTITAFYNFVENVLWHEYPKKFPLSTKFQGCNVDAYAQGDAEDFSKGQLGAVTQKCTEYVAHGDRGVVRLIDFPGIADPRGVRRDFEILLEIASFLSQQRHMSALCIVMKGELNRATVENLYAVEQLKSIISKNTVDQIFIILTHTSYVTDDAKRFLTSVGLPTKNIFVFDNLAFTEEGYVDFSHHTDAHDVSSIDDDSAALAHDVKSAWEKSTKEFARLMAAVRRARPKSDDMMNNICKSVGSILPDLDSLEKTVDEFGQYVESVRWAKVDLENAIRESAQAEQLARSKETDLLAAKTMFHNLHASLGYPAPIVQVTPAHEPVHVCLKCNQSCHIIWWQLDPIHQWQIDDTECRDCLGHCPVADHVKQMNYVSQRYGNSSLDKAKDFYSDADRNYINARDNWRRTEESISVIKACSESNKTIWLSDIKRREAESLERFAETFRTLENNSMGTFNPHLLANYEICIRAEEDLDKRTKLEKERLLFKMISDFINDGRSASR